MSKQKLVRFKNNELHTLFQLCKTSHPDIANKIKGYIGIKAVKLDKIESHRLSMQPDTKPRNWTYKEERINTFAGVLTVRGFGDE
jgi:hypothetical protein